MTFGELMQELGSISGLVRERASLGSNAANQKVTTIAYDSRQVTAGSVFIGLRGQHADGTAFAKQALSRGALAVLSESSPEPDMAARWVQVEDARLALAKISDSFYGHPSEELAVVGITGTNGKTTTAYLISSIFEAGGVDCGRIGTVSYRIGKEEREAARTTPEAFDLQRLLREMVDRGCGACAMEVSSHALALKRAEFIRFRAAVFTNLTRDHLDFHSDMEAYFGAKRRLFEMLPRDAVAAINLDDPRGASLINMVGRPMTYAIEQPADVTPVQLSFSLEGLEFDIRTPRGVLHMRSKLIGQPNTYNILAAVTVGVALDRPFSEIEKGIAQLENVPGRFQVVSGAADDITVVVDYAHTDDALKNLLETARPLAKGRVVTVFGCGGDRDRTKRPLMGAVAARLSDVVIVTSDNPRSENPEQIIEEVKRGIGTPDDRGPRARKPQRNGTVPPVCLTVVDRRAAIEQAIREAMPDDVVLVAGKGHEKYQVIGDRVLPFDDVQVVQDALVHRRTDRKA